tara:strand:- start:452 stop:643 length:192 start_codon:yes stop_codon:yes gene_type:complete
MKIKPVHHPEEECYRVYVIEKGLRQQVGTDFMYNEENQESKWVDCLRYAKEIEDQLEYYKDKD